MYRERSRACPGCAQPMDEVPVASAGETVQVDRCASCGGAFLEFFDGEPTALSRVMVRSGDAGKGARHPERPLTCPDCATAMVRKAYLDAGPEIARCEACLAVFVTPNELRELARLELPSEPAPEEGWLTRLVHWARGQS